MNNRLNVPHDSGIAVVREPEALRRAMSITASYYPSPGPKREPMQWGPDSSRRARAVEIWAALRSLGTQGVADLIEQLMTQVLGFRNGQRLREVKALSLHHRFVIVLHSPNGVAETGLCVWPPEKSARKLARGLRRDTFSGAV